MPGPEHDDTEGPFYGRDGEQLERGHDIDLSRDEDFPPDSES